MEKQRLRRYKIQFVRTEFNQWEVTGYWEVMSLLDPNKFDHWSLDGAPLYFKTRKEALEHCLTVTGVPE